MQYIVVKLLQKTQYIVLLMVLRLYKTKRLAKRRKKARFLPVSHQTETRIKLLGEGRHRRNFICRFCGFTDIKNPKPIYANLRHLRITPVREAGGNKLFLNR